MFSCKPTFTFFKNKENGQVLLVPDYTLRHEDVGGSAGTAPHIHNLALLTLLSLYLRGKRSFERNAVQMGELTYPCRELTPRSSAVQSVGWPYQHFLSCPNLRMSVLFVVSHSVSRQTSARLPPPCRPAQHNLCISHLGTNHYSI
jgi:hypothetical protein